MNPEAEPTKDRARFIEAIAGSEIQEIPAEFEPASESALKSDLRRTGLFVLGEVHGVRENADIICTLFRRFGFRNLALEWDKRLESVMDKFLKTGSVDWAAIGYGRDGRITAGHFALLRKFKDEGLMDRLICFDATDNDWDRRDAQMAKNLLDRLPGTPTLAVTGNLHSKVAAISFGGEATEHHPMGEHIREEIPGVPTGRIIYRSGEFFNCSRKKFPSIPLADSPASFHRTEEGLYIFELPEAHSAIVPDMIA